jgi:predicted lipoprotein
MKQKLLNLIVRHIFNGFNEHDVITHNKPANIIFVNDKKLTDEEVRMYREEAELIKGTQLWGLIESTLTKNAQDKIVTNSISWEDTYFGKAMLYNISVIKNILKIFVDSKK